MIKVMSEEHAMRGLMTGMHASFAPVEQPVPFGLFNYDYTQNVPAMLLF